MYRCGIFIQIIAGNLSYLEMYKLGAFIVYKVKKKLKKYENFIVWRPKKVPYPIANDRFLNKTSGQPQSVKNTAAPNNTSGCKFDTFSFRIINYFYILKYDGNFFLIKFKSKCYKIAELVFFSFWIIWQLKTQFLSKVCSLKILTTLVEILFTILNI